MTAGERFELIGNCPSCGILLRSDYDRPECPQCGHIIYPKGSVTLEGDEERVSLGISIEIDLGGDEEHDAGDQAGDVDESGPGDLRPRDE